MRGRVDGAGWSCRLVRSDVVCWSLCSGFPYVAGGWRWGLPVANRPSLVRRVPLEVIAESCGTGEHTPMFGQ